MQDLQVSIGTLELFLRTKPGTTLPQEAPAPVRPPQADLSPRIDVLETQIGALTSHIEQLTRQMSALEKKLSSAPAAIAPPPRAEPAPERQGGACRRHLRLPRRHADMPAEDDGGRKARRRRGSQSVEHTKRRGAALHAGNQPQSLAAALPEGDAQTLYQQGYGALLQKDYAGAEGAFRGWSAPIPTIRWRATRNIGSARPITCVANTRTRPTPSSRATRNTNRARRRRTRCSGSAWRSPSLARRMRPAPRSTSCKTKYPGAPEHIREEASAQRKHSGC